MTINVALITSEAIILGCDSIASATTPMSKIAEDGVVCSQADATALPNTASNIDAPTTQ